MTTRRGVKRPSPLQERYYRAGLNKGAALAVAEAKTFGADWPLNQALDHFLTRLQCRAVWLPTPVLSERHPMATWSSKKRGGR